jgi:phytoene dehydrogenase-like protein
VEALQEHPQERRDPHRALLADETREEEDVSEYDAVVVGSGPNGLAAAIAIARAGRSVHVIEGSDQVGGGSRTSELTLPGFRHDVCSAIHPMGIASPFLRTLPLEAHGLQWVHPDVPLAHPMDDGSAILVLRSLEATADNLGVDAKRYRSLMSPFYENAEALIDGFLAPLLRVPRHPFVMARFGLSGIRPAEKLLHAKFEGERARAMLGGNAAHAMVPLSAPLTGAFALVYNVFAHHVGWPMALGGSQSIADAMVAYLRTLGGTVETGRTVATVDELPSSRVVLFDTSPDALVRIAGSQLPARYVRKLKRFRYGAGVFKIDWALDEPIPWKSSECAHAGCLHLGGTIEEIAASESAVADGKHPDAPWVIVAQQSLFDATRAPSGKHTAWAYAHVPSGSTVDITDTIERQVERFAPGFRDVVAARYTATADQLSRYNPNYIGGDISSGAVSFRQMVGRPVMSMHPHATPNERIFLCSSSTPPGPGVHGMCGYFAAKAALKKL